jgi:hypothetical protein
MTIGFEAVNLGADSNCLYLTIQLGAEIERAG